LLRCPQTHYERRLRLGPKIHLALVDDWEVRGNGSGDPRVLQFEPMRRLTKVYEKFGIRGSFNAEVMQQITYRNLQGSFPELKAVADEWEELVTDSFRNGHDIQLHLHPQWIGAVYEGQCKWNLRGDWSIVNYSSQQIRTLLLSGRQFLETLLRKVDPSYSCVSFRAGSWCAAPSDSLFPILAELEFVFDMSIVAGIRYDTPRVKLDYTQCEEPFLPYYPQMNDARRVSRTFEPMVCVPTNSFRVSPPVLLQRDLGKARRALRLKTKRPDGHPAASSHGGNKDWTNRGESGAIGFARRMVKRYFRGETYISDLSNMKYPMMLRMMDSIRERAAESGLEHVPVILENHTKDVRDFSDIERFLADVAHSADVKTVTLTEIANGLRNGSFTVRTA
jgi:hypothetical protein